MGQKLPPLESLKYSFDYNKDPAINAMLKIQKDGGNNNLLTPDITALIQDMQSSNYNKFVSDYTDFATGINDGDLEGIVSDQDIEQFVNSLNTAPVIEPDPEPVDGQTYVDHSNTSAFGNPPSINALDVHQNQVGDCGVISTLQSIAAKDPNSILDHIQKIGPTADGKNDIYDVQLYINNKWQNFTITSALPNGGATSDPQHMWGPLMEKAIAVATKKGYVGDNLDAGDVMSLVSGTVPTRGAVDHGDNIEMPLLAARNGDPAVVAGTAKGNGYYDTVTGKYLGANGAHDDPDAVWLSGDHYYSVLSDDNGVVTLLNPWNQQGPNGYNKFTMSEAAFKAIYLGWDISSRNPTQYHPDPAISGAAWSNFGDTVDSGTPTPFSTPAIGGPVTGNTLDPTPVTV